MVGIYGIGGIPDPANTTTPGIASKKDTTQANKLRTDGVLISAEAQDASSIAKMLETSDEQAKLQAERVAQARQRIEQGTYKMQDVVRLVASRLTRFVSSGS